MKASDISDERIYEIIGMSPGGSVTLLDIQIGLPGFPQKLVLAKLRRMINKGRLEGCACGCRGPFSRPKPPGDTWTAHPDQIRMMEELFQDRFDIRSRHRHPSSNYNLNDYGQSAGLLWHHIKKNGIDFTRKLYESERVGPPQQWLLDERKREQVSSSRASEERCSSSPPRPNPAE